jgi:hypothetical protein
MQALPTAFYRFQPFSSLSEEIWHHPCGGRAASLDIPAEGTAFFIQLEKNRMDVNINKRYFTEDWSSCCILLEEVLSMRIISSQPISDTEFHLPR